MTMTLGGGLFSRRQVLDEGPRGHVQDAADPLHQLAPLRHLLHSGAHPPYGGCQELKFIDRQTDRQTYRQTDRQTDR